MLVRRVKSLVDASMAGLVPAIDIWCIRSKDVDVRIKSAQVALCAGRVRR